jgi:hypothetical protein
VALPDLSEEAHLFRVIRAQALKQEFLDARLKLLIFHMPGLATGP